MTRNNIHYASVLNTSLNFQLLISLVICILAIRVATQWYQSHLGAAARILLITNDRENKRKASEEGIAAETGTSQLLSYILSNSGIAVLVRFNSCLAWLLLLPFLLPVLSLCQIIRISLCAKPTCKYFFVSVESYVKSLGQPGLLDLLVQPASEDVGMEEVEDLRPSKRKVIYSEVLPIISVHTPTNVEPVTITFRFSYMHFTLFFLFRNTHA